ncbi:MAG: DUF2914 domain-containing protein [Candidatus Zixiibacteriota bacterium]|nr:MAG: DUF2914 domain-containing protein [candidate division Zixibacteria bacterium]
MRGIFLTAVIIGILFLPVYAQTPEPVEADTTEEVAEPETTQEMAEPETTEEMAEPEEVTEPEAAEEAEEVEEPAEMDLNLTVKEMTFCAGVEDREPVSRDTTFSSDAGNVFFWSNVLNDGYETVIEHVWYYNGEEMARVELPARYPRNRVWSSKTILPEWTGEWTVMVMAGSEKLGEMTCTVE